jgi:hypothetical protein
MHAYRITAAVLALALLAACAPAGGANSDQLSALEARVAALEGAGTTAADGLTDASLRLAALEAKVTTLEEAHDHAEAGVFELAVAQYFMDTAGFHGMDVALNDTGVVEPAYLSTVNRVNKVMRATPWPADLHEQAEAFQGLLSELAEALDADDAAAAADLAASVHEAQHDLSHAIDELLGVGGHGH